VVASSTALLAQALGLVERLARIDAFTRFLEAITSWPPSRINTPLQALPGLYRFLTEFEPLRQITGGIRSNLYYDAQGDAGPTRG
jgi:hypothetical protein